MLGETRDLRKVFFETVIVKKYSYPEIFEQKLELIEQNKSQGLPTKVLEQQIDELLFNHYGLTPSEIETIERSPSLSELSDKAIRSTSASVSL